MPKAVIPPQVTGDETLATCGDLAAEISGKYVIPGQTFVNFPGDILDRKYHSAKLKPHHMTIWNLSLAIVISAIAAGCSAVHVTDTEADAGFKLTNYKTFDFFKLEGSGDTSENFAANAVLLKQSITRELESRGIKQSTLDPDLLINIGAVVEEQIQTRETSIREAPRYLGTRNYSWKAEEVEVGRYKVGTVTVDLVDRASNKMVWKGVVEGTLPAKQEKIPSTIDEGMKALFQKLAPISK